MTTEAGTTGAGTTGAGTTGAGTTGAGSATQQRRVEGETGSERADDRRAPGAGPAAGAQRVQDEQDGRRRAVAPAGQCCPRLVDGLGRQAELLLDHRVED